MMLLLVLATPTLLQESLLQAIAFIDIM